MRAGIEFREAVRSAWSALWSHKLRATLTTFGIVIGIVTVTLMATAISGLNHAFRESISQLGSDVLFVQKFPWLQDEEWWRWRNRRDITLADARRLASQVTLARAVSIEAARIRSVSYRDRTVRAVWIMGNTEESDLVRGLIMQEGRFFSAAEVGGARPICVLGAELKDKLFPNESPIGKTVKIESSNYEIIGVTEKMGQFLFANLDRQVIIPITKLITEMAHDPDVTITVKVKDTALLDEAEAELRGIMRKIRRLAPGAEDDFAINQQQILLRAFERVGGTLALAGLFITGLSLFVGGIGITNIMLVSVAERTPEIGIRKALGAKRRSILLQFLAESAMICLFGGTLALMIGYPLSLGLRHFLPANFSIGVAAVALAMSLITGLAAGIFPAYRAACMNPVEALRKE